MTKTIVNFHGPKTAGTTFGVQMHRALSGAQIPDAFQHIQLKGDTTQGDDSARLRRIFQERFSEQHGKCGSRARRS